MFIPPRGDVEIYALDALVGNLFWTPIAVIGAAGHGLGSRVLLDLFEVALAQSAHRSINDPALIGYLEYFLLSTIVWPKQNGVMPSVFESAGGLPGPEHS